MELAGHIGEGIDIVQELFAPLAHQMHAIFKIEFDFNMTHEFFRNIKHHVKDFLRPIVLDIIEYMIQLHHHFGLILMWAMSGLFHLLESLKMVECESDDLNSLDAVIMTAESNAEIIPVVVSWAVQNPGKLLLCTSEGINLIDWAESRFSRFMRHWFNRERKAMNKLNKRREDFEIHEITDDIRRAQRHHEGSHHGKHFEKKQRKHHRREEQEAEERELPHDF